MAEGPRKPRVLLVEDNLDVLHASGKLLGKEGYDVRLAQTMAEAIAMARAETFDVIVTDIGLPDGDGFELMGGLTGEPGPKGIAVSGWGRDAFDEEKVRRSFSAFLEKPVLPEQLHRAISAALR